jgi:hypothetical protein
MARGTQIPAGLKPLFYAIAGLGREFVSGFGRLMFLALTGGGAQELELLPVTPAPFA